MDESLLIIVEGPQGSGKTTTTNLLREKITSSTLIRTAGVKEASNYLTYKYHRHNYILIENLHDVGTHFILDRSHLTEAVYCDLGLKPYPFRSERKLLNEYLEELGKYYNVLIVILTANKATFEKRLKRDKGEYKFSKFSVENSLNQAKAYVKLLDDFNCSESIKTLTIDTSNKTPDEVVEIILDNVYKGNK